MHSLRRLLPLYSKRTGTGPAQSASGAHVCCGSIASIHDGSVQVRFTLNSDRTADMADRPFVPERDIGNPLYL
jgi:hypothetical protein